MSTPMLIGVIYVLWSIGTTVQVWAPCGSLAAESALRLVVDSFQWPGLRVLPTLPLPGCPTHYINPGEKAKCSTSPKSSKS